MRLRDSAAIALSTLVVTGSPDGAGRDQASDEKLCQKRGEQCKLPSGALGVCDDVPCKAGQNAPCLGCTAQH